MNITYALSESERWNAVIKLEIDNSTHQETHYGWAWYTRLKQLDNFVSEEDLADYRDLLRVTDELWKKRV